MTVSVIMLLAIDTATRVMSLALHDGYTLLAEKSWRAGNRHTTQLAPAIQRLLYQCEVTTGDLTALGVSIGPGSYTGLRIGVALAKGLAAVNHLPLVGITTLETLAAGQPHYQSRYGLITIVQAGRGRIVVQTYRWNRGEWVGRGEPTIMTWDQLFASIDGPAYITGEVDGVGQAALKTAQEESVPVTLAPAAHRLRRAGYLAEVAWKRLREDKNDFDAARVMPIYLKSKKESSKD